MPDGRSGPLKRLVCAAVWLPALGAPLFLALLAVRFDELTASIHSNSDGSAPALIAESLGRGGAHGGPTVLGDISYATTLLAFWLTRWIPGHRELWNALPALLFVAGGALLAWSSWRLAGRWAAALTLTLSVALGTDALFTQLAPAFHGTTWFMCALLAAFLVALSTGSLRPPRRLRVAWVLLGVLCGLNLASDPLLALTGLAPFVLAAWLGPRGAETRRHVRLALATSAVALVTAGATLAVLTLADIRTRRTERGDSYVLLASPEDIARHLGQLWRYTLAIFGAGQGTGSITIWPDALLAGVAIAALGGVLWLGLRVSWRREGPAALATRFWAIGVVLLAMGFVLSQIPDPDARLVGGDGLLIPDRYLVPLVLAVAATLPVWAAGGLARRAVVAAGTAVLAGAAIAALITSDLAGPRERLPIARQAGSIASYLRAEGIARGYGDYWSAHAMTYVSGITTRAVIDCDLGRAVVPCPLRINARRGWYRPVAGRSFVMVDATTEAGRGVGRLVASGSLGAPVGGRDFGPIRVHLFADDAAGRLRGRWGARGEG